MEGRGREGEGEGGILVRIRMVVGRYGQAYLLGSRDRLERKSGGNRRLVVVSW